MSVPPGVRLVSVPVDARRPGLSWLAIQAPDTDAQSLGMLDVKMYRDAVEHVLRDA